MQNKVVLYSKNQTEFQKIKEIEKSLLKAGLFDFSFSTYCTFEDFVKACQDAKTDSDTILCVCPNNNIDTLLQKVKTANDSLSLVKEQAVKLEENSTYKKMLFVPIELEIEEFLPEIVSAKDVYMYSVFGKSASFATEKFEELANGGEFKIFSHSVYLHTIFCSKQIENEKLVEIFGESLFANKQTTLQDCCVEILKEQGLVLSVADGLCGVFAKLAQCENATKNIFAESEILLADKDYAKFGLDETFLTENGTVSKETAFALSKNLLQKSQSEIVLAIVGFDCDGGRSFVAVGNKQEIHVFSSVFYGKKDEIDENVSDFALFKLLCFLKEKYQQNH